MENIATRNSPYFDFIRTRTCSFCFSPYVEPHHVRMQLRGVSQAGMAQKVSDYRAIPVCHPCLEKLENGSLRPDRAELLELMLMNLICYLEIWEPHPRGVIVEAQARIVEPRQP
jgi:hypothetical protein